MCAEEKRLKRSAHTTCKLQLCERTRRRFAPTKTFYRTNDEFLAHCLQFELQDDPPTLADNEDYAKIQLSQQPSAPPNSEQKRSEIKKCVKTCTFKD